MVTLKQVFYNCNTETRVNSANTEEASMVVTLNQASMIETLSQANPYDRGVTYKYFIM